LKDYLPLFSEGNNSIFFRRSFFPWYALGMPSFNNSVGLVLTQLQLGMTGKLSKNFHGVGIGPLSTIYAVNNQTDFISGK